MAPCLSLNFLSVSAWHYQVQYLTIISWTPDNRSSRILLRLRYLNRPSYHHVPLKCFLGKQQKMLVNTEKWCGLLQLLCWPVTTSAGRSFHMSIILWLKVNLRRWSLSRSFSSFSPRSVKVSTIWKMSRHWTPSWRPWRIFWGQYQCLPWSSCKIMNQGLQIGQ